MGAPNLASSLIPESLDNNLSYSIVNYLKRLKNQAKVEFDRVCTEVGRTRPAVVEAIKVVSRSPFRKDFISNPNLIGIPFTTIIYVFTLIFRLIYLIFYTKNRFGCGTGIFWIFLKVLSKSFKANLYVLYVYEYLKNIVL